MALAGKFRFEGSADDLLTRMGAVSALRGIRYWSVSDNGWRTLIEHASALEGPDLSRRRPDFVAAELKKGRIVYFAHDDNRTAGEIIYRLEIRELASDRLVVATENVSPVRQFMLTLVDSGGLQTLHFLNRDSPGVWRYYVLARTSEDLSSLLGVSQRSYVTARSRSIGTSLVFRLTWIRRWPPNWHLEPAQKNKTIVCARLPNGARSYAGVSFESCSEALIVPVLEGIWAVVFERK